MKRISEMVQTLFKRKKGISGKREYGNPVVIPDGRALIPDGVEEIRSCCFDDKKFLKRVELPPSVKRIGDRAFADCPALTTVVLNEGLEEIGSNVFCGSRKLKTLVIPDSVRKVDAFLCHGTDLSDLVFNASRTRLHYCPEHYPEKCLALPEGILQICSGAFLDNKCVEEVILPEGLEQIDERAFLDSSLWKLIIPASTRKIASHAFWRCRKLEKVILRCDSTVLGDGAFYRCGNARIITNTGQISFEEELRIHGMSLYAEPMRLMLPEMDFWQDAVFADHAERCSRGDTAAMLALADHYETLGSESFFLLAANFWRYRAYLLGNAEAAQWRSNWLENHHREHIPVAMSPKLRGTYNGDVLRALGFAFFEADREYSLDGVDKDGLVEVSSWCGEEGPDSDGFGREELYDWWYLDRYLNRIPGSKMLHGWERRTKQYRKDAFDSLHSGTLLALKLWRIRK